MELNNVKLDWNLILEKQILRLQEMYPENEVKKAYENIISLLNENKIRSRVIASGNRVVCYAFVLDYSGFTDRLYAVMGFEDTSFAEETRIQNLVSWIEGEGKRSGKSILIGYVHNITERVEEFLLDRGFSRMERIRLELDLEKYTPPVQNNQAGVLKDIFSITPAAYSDADYSAFLGSDDVILFPTEREQRVLFTSGIFDGRLGGMIPEASKIIMDGEKVIAGIISVESGGQVDYIRRALIADIFVDRNYRRRGYGSLMLASSLSRLKDLGYTSVILWVSSKNPAKSLYEKFHFSDRGYGREVSYFLNVR